MAQHQDESVDVAGWFDKWSRLQTAWEQRTSAVFQSKSNKGCGINSQDHTVLKQFKVERKQQEADLKGQMGPTIFAQVQKMYKQRRKASRKRKLQDLKRKSHDHGRLQDVSTTGFSATSTTKQTKGPYAEVFAAFQHHGVSSSRSAEHFTGKGNFEASSHPVKVAINTHLATLARAGAQFRGPGAKWALVLDTEELQSVQALTKDVESDFDPTRIIVPNPDLRECFGMRSKTEALVLPVTTHALLHHLPPKLKSPNTAMDDEWAVLSNSLTAQKFPGFSFVYVV